VRDTNQYTVDAAALRSIGVVALLGIGAIHFLQIVDTFQSTPLLGMAYAALIAACVVVAAWLLVTGDVRAWGAAGLISVAVILGYAFTRLVGTTFDNQDVGNWSCMLGLASLFVEAALLALSSFAIALERTFSTREPAKVIQTERALETGSNAGLTTGRGATTSGRESMLSSSR
jgi:hypothetical protein